MQAKNPYLWAFCARSLSLFVFVWSLPLPIVRGSLEGLKIGLFCFLE